MFELTDAPLCTDGPVRTLVGRSLAPEHRRRHGAIYDALNHGRIDVETLRQRLAPLPLPRATDGRLVLAVDVFPTVLVTARPVWRGPTTDRAARTGAAISISTFATVRHRTKVTRAGLEGRRPGKGHQS